MEKVGNITYLILEIPAPTCAGAVKRFDLVLCQSDEFLRILLTFTSAVPGGFEEYTKCMYNVKYLHTYISYTKIYVFSYLVLSSIL